MSVRTPLPQRLDQGAVDDPLVFGDEGKVEGPGRGRDQAVHGVAGEVVWKMLGQDRDLWRDLLDAPAHRSQDPGLADFHGRIAEEVVDGEELGEGAGLGVVGLGGEEGVAEAVVVSGDELLYESQVEEVGGLVEGEAAG